MKKLKSNKGLTIMELMCCIAILTLISATVVLGVRLGVDSYIENTTKSQAQMLCSSLTTVISDELRYARQIETDADTAVVYNPSFEGTLSTVDAETNTINYISYQVVDGKLQLGSNIEVEGVSQFVGTDVGVGVGVYSSSHSKVQAAPFPNPDEDQEAANRFWIKYDSSRNVFTVNLVILNRYGTQILAKNQFEVKTLNPNPERDTPAEETPIT